MDQTNRVAADSPVVLPSQSWANQLFCTVSSSCFLTHIQVSQDTGEMVCYFHLSKSFPQFVMIHTVKGFSVVDETKIDVFWNSPAFSIIQQMLEIWSLVPLPFLNPAWDQFSERQFFSGRGCCVVLGWFKPITFILYFIIFTSVPLQIIRP